MSEEVPLNHFKDSDDEAWRSVTLADVADKRSENVDPDEVDLDRHIGLEHIESNNPNPEWEPTNEVSSTKRRFEAGDILFAKLRPNLEKAAQPDFEGVASTDLFPIVSRQEVNAKYLLYRLSSKDAFDYARRTSVGTRMPRTSWNLFSKYEFDLPGVEEQRKIASVLYNVGRAIQNSDEIIKQTERVQRGFVQKRVTSQNSDAERKQGIVGTRRVTIPEHWSVVRLGDVAEIVSGKSFPREYQEGHAGSQAVIKVEDMNFPGNDKYIKEVTNRVSNETLDELNKNIFPRNTVIHPRVGEALLLNKTRITAEDAAFDDNIMGWVPDGINPEYLYYASTLIDFNAVAQTGTVPSINKGMAGNFRFPLPPEEEQEEIVKDLSRIDAQISIYEQEKKQLQRIKQGLMQDLLSGEVRTNDKDIEVLDEVKKYG